MADLICNSFKENILPNFHNIASLSFYNFFLKEKNQHEYNSNYFLPIDTLQKIFKNYFVPLLNSDEAVFYDLEYNFFNSTIATYHSFAGNHKAALDSEANYANIDMRIFNKEKRNIISPNQYLFNKIKDKKIIAFNEAHHDVRARAYLLSILDSLKKIGFTHLALETLSQLPKNNILKHKDGYYSNENLYANIINLALKLGFKLICYDAFFSKNREKQSAKNILKKINFNNGDRLIVFCGYAHIMKNKNNYDKNKFLIRYLQDFTNIEPYTIDLQGGKNSYFKDSIINNFYVLQNKNNADSFFNSGGNTDLCIFYPNEIYYFDYEYYYKNKILNFIKKTYFTNDTLNMKTYKC